MLGSEYLSDRYTILTVMVSFETNPSSMYLNHKNFSEPNTIAKIADIKGQKYLSLIQSKPVGIFDDFKRFLEILVSQVRIYMYAVRLRQLHCCCQNSYIRPF